jgi:hypothetical protein
VELFENFERCDPSRGTRTESIFHFLNRVAGPKWQAVRHVMNEWFGKWPADAQLDLRARFRDDDPHQSIGAFWELYLHELFGSLGYQLKRDPEVPGTTKRPDFLVSDDLESFYLEATIVGHSDEEKSTKRRRDIMLDLVDEARSPGLLGQHQGPGRGARDTEAKRGRPADRVLASRPGLG